jgi:hypothetical protein
MKRDLTPKEKRTILIAAIGVGIYLLLFYGPGARSFFTKRREAYDKLVQQARDLRDVIKPYEEKASTAESLMERLRMDPAKLNRSSVMAEASAAIQDAAAAEGVGVGPIRETAGRSSTGEAGTIQFEGTGPIVSVMHLLRALERAGVPIIVDSIRFGAAQGMPNGIKVSLNIVVLDFDHWKAKEEASHA